MHVFIKTGLQVAWGLFLFYWILSAKSSKESIQTETPAKRFLVYWFPLIIAALLLGPGEWFGHSLIRENFVPHNNLVGSIGLAISFSGAAIACWSRYLLGRNWSATVQLKKEHELITKGPYQFLRHPIYTGILLLFTGNAIIVGDYRGIIAVLIVFASFWRKLKLEEKWLGEHFGSSYYEYTKKTKAIVPFIL
jgi:protein-S-isoprenylcysteine O-methyltransferase Ste14